jgi:hypothetical protein
MTQVVAAVLIALALVGCAITEEERARIARVRVIKTPDAVRGCESLGSVTDDEIRDLQKKAARLGGDTALVILQQPQGRPYGGGFRTYTTAEVYRCGAR